MDSPATSSPRKESRVWLLWFSVGAQQIVFLLAYGLRIPLIAISEWVIFVPVVIVWALYVAVPLLTPKEERKHALLRAYALTGWIFVIAAVSWTATYISLSKKYGTPVSYAQMQEIQKREIANQPLQGTPGKASPPATEPEARRP